MHYSDKTAEKALQNIEMKNKRRIAEAMACVRKVLKSYGLELVGRIEIMDSKTGRVWR